MDELGAIPQEKCGIFLFGSPLEGVYKIIIKLHPYHKPGIEIPV
jgi:hypothetical protein